MSIRKIIALTLTGLGIAGGGMTSALAGGPDTQEYMVPSFAGVYIEGNLGYAYRPWINDVTTEPGFINLSGELTSISNGNGGFTGGADLGYQFNQFFSAEAGWYYLPKFSATSFPNDPAVRTAASITGGLAYAAIKGMAPLANNLYLFGKVGAAYTYNNGTVQGQSGTTSSDFWSPMLASGLQYYLSPNWSVNAQYAYVPGYRSSHHFIVPDAQLITAGIGYKILM